MSGACWLVGDGAELQEVAFGWRIWFSDGTGLFPPTACRDFKASHRIVTAWCPDSAHEPPAEECTCGFYCFENLVDALFFLRVTQFNLRTRTSSAVCFEGPAGNVFAGRNQAGHVPVLSRVAVFRARAHHRLPNGQLFVARELRAAAMCIEQLWVAGASDACPHWLSGCRFVCHYCPNAERGAESLSAALGLRTVVGLPRYSYHDWQTRSDWFKQLGPQGISDPLDDTYLTWFRNDEPVVPFTAPAPAPGETLAGEEICRSILDAPGLKREKTLGPVGAGAADGTGCD